MNLYEVAGSNISSATDPFGLQRWYQGWGRTLGTLVGYYDGAGEAWESFGEGYSQATYGAVGGLTGGLFDSDYGFFGNADDVKQWLGDSGWGDINDDSSAYESGTNGARHLLLQRLLLQRFRLLP